MSAMLAYMSSFSSKIYELDITNKVYNSGPWAKASLLAFSLYGTYHGIGLVYTHYRRRLNDKKRDAKRQENKDSIQVLKERLRNDPMNEMEVQWITNLPVSHLLNELKSGKIRPIDALKAYQIAALKAHEKTNCLIEAFPEAEKRALDLEKGPKEGLLWGLPISIKDDIRIKGHDNAIGLVNNTGRPAEENASLLKIFLHHGAIPFVKTNVPQTEMSFEPGNPINGIVHNPHALDRGPGGSSSGEAALIASHGSPLGVGSDIAGSIRVPAHFCGIQGFKPTPERSSYRGMAFDSPLCINTIQGIWGPLSRDVEGLVLQMRALWEDCLINKYEPRIPWQPFDHKEYGSSRKLRIGYFMDTSFFPTFSACKRAVKETIDLLAKEGHELVPWQPPQIESTVELGWRILSSTEAILKEELKYDRIAPCIANAYLRGHRLPDIIRRILDIFIRPLSPKTADKMGLRVDPMDTLTFMNAGYELVQFRRLVHDAWVAENLDAVICPPSVMVAPPHGSSALLLDTCIYSFFYNLMHYPAGVVRVTKVKESDLINLDKHYPDTSNKLQQEAKAAMTSSVGLPVGVMVATPRYRDETCLRIMKIIEQNQAN